MNNVKAESQPPSFMLYNVHPHSPPVSLIKEIMERQFHAHTTVPALQWGIDNKPCARQQFLHNAQHDHFNLRYFPAGLFVNPRYPHLGATPDGIISCDCCGTGIIEIKCPYKHLDSHPTEVNDDTFYLLNRGNSLEKGSSILLSNTRTVNAVGNAIL